MSSIVLLSKKALLNIALLLTSLAGYLEWGGDQKVFLFAAEWEIIVKGINDPGTVAHPFVIIPMAGQLLLVIALFSTRFGRQLTIAGILCIAVLFLFMMVIGALSFNLKIFSSTLPFFIISIIAIRHHRKQHAHHTTPDNA